MADSSQKFIARNRAPRVQIEYDVELYGTQKKVQLPFVMGVMSDLAGKSKVEQPAVADRKFLEIDADNFDERMKGLAPRAAFTVPNTLTGEGNLAVDLTFESMADFSPGAIAAKVDALRPLLEARTRLQNLMAYMDGKAGAEALIETILNDPSLLQAVSAPAADTDSAAALDSLRNLELPEEKEDTTGEVLAGLAAQVPVVAEPDESADALASLAAAEVPETAEKDRSAAVFEGLAQAEVPEPEEEDTSGDVLAGLAAEAPEEIQAEDTSGSVLEELRAAEPDEADAGDGSADVLAGLSAAAPQEEDQGDAAGDALASLAGAEVPDAEEDDQTGSVLEGLAQADITEQAEDTSGEVLAGLAAQEVEEDAPEDTASAALESLSAVEVVEAEEEDHSGVLGALADTGVEEPEDTAAEDALESLAAVEVEAPEAEDHSDILEGLADLEAEKAADEAEDVSGVLSDLADIETDAEEADTGESSDDVLAGLAVDLPEEAVDEEDGLDSILGGLDAPEEAEDSEDLSAVLDTLDASAEEDADDGGLDDLLGDLGSDSVDETAEEDAGEVLDALTEDEDGSDDAGGGGPDLDLDAMLNSGAEATAGNDDLDSLLGDLDSEDTGEADDTSLDDLLGDLGSGEEVDGDLDDLLAGLGEEVEAEDAADAESGEEDLDALLDGLGDADSDLDSLMGDDGDMDLDDLLGDLGGGDEVAEDAGGDDLDALLGDLDDGGSAAEAAAAVQAPEEPEFAYGTMSADRPEPQKLERKRFRLAVLGDFSGRAAKGQLETGDALAARKAILLDPDTVEDVIARFATELVLPIGKDGAGIAVRLEDLDGLHPDELYENVELFSELVGLRKQLQSGATADHAAKTLKAWAEKYGTRARAPKRTSAGNAVPADKRLSAFQQLIKDTGITPRPATPVEELLARVVGPHIRALPDPDVASMQKAVDEALSDAMRLVLHHPEFQSVEAQWRSLDLMARSIEADDTLDVMLYDISAEELAADLAAEEDLSKTGFVRLLTGEPLDEENGRGGYSALIGMYQFEETPPHAELLGRIARVAAHVDAPFFASISPEFLKTPKAERPKVVADAWDTLQGMAEAGHLGLVSPRFLLRRPYGEKTEPCYEFDFEEFTETEGLKGMLWANPVVLVAILLARSFKEYGPSLQLGKIMSLGGMPYHYVNDKFGDQVALPCTERNIDLDKIALAQERGFMAVSAVKGRDEVRLTSFNSLKGSEILGPWTGLPAPEPSPPDPRGLPKPKPAADEGDEDDLDLGGDDGDDLGLDDLDLGGDDEDDLDLGDLDFEADDGGLDDLLASFGDDDDDDGDEEMDAELAALLDDL